MSRASKLASARGQAHSARHATNVARDKLQRITNERDKLQRELADLRARLEKAENDAERFNTLISLPPIEAQAIFWNASSRTERTKMIDAIAKERT